jgi:hypothetical protein
MHRVLWLLACTGCAQLAGIDNTTDERTGVSLTIERVSIGATVIRTPADLTGHTAVYLAEEGEVPATTSAPGVWNADIRAQTPPVRFTTPTNNPDVRQTNLWTFPNGNIIGEYGVLEHPGAAPPSPDATITATLTLDTPYAGNELVRIYTVGAWAYRDFGAAELPAPGMGIATVGPVTFPMASMNSFTGRPLERITPSDAILALKYVGGDLVAAAEAPAFDQNLTDTITATYATVAHDKVLEVNIDPAGNSARFSAARPAVANIAMSWAVYAAPGYSVNNAQGPQLIAAGIVPTDPASVLTASYGNPFTRDWKPMFQMVATANRTYTPPPPELPVTLSAAMVQLMPEPAKGVDAKFPAGLPELIALDGRSLSTDNVAIAKPTAPVTLTFTTDRGAGSLYVGQLYELIPNADNTALTYKLVITASALEPTFVFAPNLLEAGKLYTFRAISYMGAFPNIAAGDLRNTTGTGVAYGYLDSGVVRVMP